MKKTAFATLVMATGLFAVGATVAEAACVTTRNGTNSRTNCDGVITERSGNKSITYNRDGSTTQRRGNESVTRGRGYDTYREGNRSVTIQKRRKWYEY